MKKLPTGLYSRPRTSVIWCWYYVKGQRQPSRKANASRHVQPLHGDAQARPDARHIPGFL